MSVSFGRDGSVALEGVVSLEDAERLLGLLIDNPEAPVDWRSCTGCHSAALQVLLAARRQMIGPPASDFLRRWIDLD